MAERGGATFARSTWLPRHPGLLAAYPPGAIVGNHAKAPWIAGWPPLDDLFGGPPEIEPGQGADGDAAEHRPRVPSPAAAMGRIVVIGHRRADRRVGLDAAPERAPALERGPATQADGLPLERFEPVWVGCEVGVGEVAYPRLGRGGDLDPWRRPHRQ